MVMLSKVSNDGINENLKKRHQSDMIYVSTISSSSVKNARSYFI